MRKAQNNQLTTYFNEAMEDKQNVFIYLTNGIRLEGTIKEFDDSSVLLINGNDKNLIFKHAIASVFRKSFNKIENKNVC